MCLTPSTIYLDDKAPVQVACRKCRLCIDNRTTDLVGRCIAEAKVAKASFALTLTYGGGDTPESVIPVMAHVQKLLKLLRRRGFECRSLQSAEYGSEKGRVHWHQVLFFTGAVPDMPALDTECQHWHYVDDNGVRKKWWPHGFVFCQRVNFKTIRYAVKYTLKDQADDAKASVYSWSKKPPLGYWHFIDLAERYAEQGISPQSPEYSFRDVRDKNGKIRVFWLSGKMRELFNEHFKEAYFRFHGTPYPFSEYLDAEDDRIIRRDYLVPDWKWRKIVAEREGIVAVRQAAREKADQNGVVSTRLVDYVAYENGVTVARYPDGSVFIVTEDQEWRVTNPETLERAITDQSRQQKHPLPY
ncbi:replication initiation protein [Tortoise microvirus 37]|nr:replication initiation protein [Tortoise microvirus 37]